MITYSVKVEGLDKFAAGLKQLGQETVGLLSEATKKSVLSIESASKKEAPVNKSYGGGNLRQRILSRMVSPLAGRIDAGVSYAVYVHEGTRPHEIRPVVKKGLANVRTNQFFGKLVHHPGTRPNPFFTRAIKRAQSDIQGHFNDALAKMQKMLK